MSSTLRMNFGWMAVPILTVGLLAAVGARADDYDPSYAAPHVVKPGEITMQDVLQVHNAQQRSITDQATQATAPNSTSPALTAPSTTSSVNAMMMQGLKTVLQESGAPTAPAVKPPVVKASTADAAAEAPAAAIATPATPGVTYQPGQAPQNLGAVGVPAAVTSNPPLPPEATETPATETPAAAQPAANGACEPHVTTWVKTCVEAGYPDNFTGEIKGETRTACPNNALQDVWVSNTCASPDLSDDSSAPLTAPTNPQAMPAANVAPGMPAPAVPAMQAYSEHGDASCGPVNGLAALSKPKDDLCNAGMPTDVTGDGPWRWSCRGTNGGMTVSCAAPVAPRPATVAPSPASTTSPAQKSSSTPATVVEDGACGASDGSVVEQAPETNLCNKGLASRVNGAGPWTWACSGLNGGQAVSCSATRRIDGVCGSANNATANEMPMSELCDAGYASAVTGNGPWNWTCSGLYGGQAATCSAAPRQDAVCGDASLNGHRDAPREDLCSVGQSSSVTGDGPWSWTCNGANGGSPVSCEAPISVSGACGSANGIGVAEAPSDNLCAKGKSTRVTGTGPWQWNCSGSDGGDTESCTAPLASGAVPVASATPATTSSAATTAAATPTATATNSPCGTASELAAITAPDTGLCTNGKASAVSGNGPWTWTCTDKGQKTSCSTLSPTGSFETAATTTPTAIPSSSTTMPAPSAAPTAAVVAVDEKASCGMAATQGLSRAPTDNLCSVGKASKVSGEGPWDWTCTKGKSHASCEAAPLVNGMCGASNGATQSSAPASGLCSAGTPTAIQGSGPWLWTCVGTGGGSSISCSAAAQSKTRVDGNCGAASNAPTPNAPSVNLCDSGVASNVYGDGPWTWTCSGLNGGIASSCSAQRNIPPAPPAPGPAVNGLCGAANGAAMLVQPMDGLCSSGTVTAVSGNGPWNWNCLGENGGMTVSCTSPLQPPAPITGACGNASGIPTLTAPRSALCSAGITSAVSGQGPWTWSCSGTNGGGAVACVAPLAGAGGTGSLPGLVTAPTTPYGEAPVPNAAPMAPVHSGSLVTPQLPSGALPPLATGTMPELTPSKVFETPPAPSAMPPVPAPQSLDMNAPAESPDLPAGTQPLQPPPVRDTIQPSAAAKPIGYDAQGNLMPGNHFALEDDVSTIAFEPKADNFAATEAPKLDKLVQILQVNGNVRITLTAYADVDATTNPRDARRLSLSRALAIRDYLTTKGISSARIDVRALGANTFSGDYDRVDIKAN